MSGDRISDEAVQAAVDTWFERWSGSESHVGRMRRALSAALPLLEGGKGEPVAWAIELEDGCISALGWSDMRLHDAAQKMLVLVPGARYVYAYTALRANAGDKA